MIDGGEHWQLAIGLARRAAGRLHKVDFLGSLRHGLIGQ
jgi:hypothetical protein